MLVVIVVVMVGYRECNSRRCYIIADRVSERGLTGAKPMLMLALDRTIVQKLLVVVEIVATVMKVLLCMCVNR